MNFIFCHFRRLSLQLVASIWLAQIVHRHMALSCATFLKRWRNSTTTDKSTSVIHLMRKWRCRRVFNLVLINDTVRSDTRLFTIQPWPTIPLLTDTTVLIVDITNKNTTKANIVHRACKWSLHLPLHRPRVCQANSRRSFTTSDTLRCWVFTISRASHKTICQLKVCKSQFI